MHVVARDLGVTCSNLDSRKHSVSEGLLVVGSLLVATPQPSPDAADACLHDQPTAAASVQLDWLRAIQGSPLHQGQEATGSAYT